MGLVDQKILDIGTGTGLLARHLAENGCAVSGIDISDNQITAAKKLASSNNLKIDFKVSNVDKMPFPDNSFDCVVSSNSWQYFNTNKVIKEIKRVLKNDGLFIISHFSWLPQLNEIARASEELAIKYNPSWKRENWNNSAEIDDRIRNGGVVVPFPDSNQEEIILRGMFFYDEEIPFTRSQWRGRFRASRGIGASLNQQQVEMFDEEHEELLNIISGEMFTITHRIDAHIYSFQKFTGKHDK